jgi:hypothetical protein
VQVFAGFLAAISIVAQTQAAAAQAALRIECPACRAFLPFNTCDRPVDGTTVVRGRVIGVERGPCSQILSLDLVRTSETNQPTRIRVDLGPCRYRAGNTSDIIDFATNETLQPETSSYLLVCRSW